MKPEARLRYARRMAPVLRWLATHPDSEDLSAGEVSASKACA